MMLFNFTSIIVSALNRFVSLAGTTRRRLASYRRVDNSSMRQVGQSVSLTESNQSGVCPSRKVHTNYSYVCSYCSKSFTVSTNLTAHLRTHTGERPFWYHLCPQAFTQKVHLVDHMRLHMGERPFLCRFCPMAFVRKLQRRYHEHRMHSKRTAAA